MHHNNVDCVVWMLNNGSSLSENVYANIGKSCEDILKTNGIYDKVKNIRETKSSRK